MLRSLKTSKQRTTQWLAFREEHGEDLISNSVNQIQILKLKSGCNVWQILWLTIV